MTLEIHIVDVAQSPLAAVRARTDRDGLGQAIVGSLDKVYAVLRARKITGLGCNVVVYPPGPPGVFEIEAGVQTPSPIEPEGAVIASRTPAGRAATVTFFGPYADLPSAHEAIQHWLRERGLAHDVSWEVYGDWSDDPAQLRTDVFYRIREGQEP